jgi:hypothetical protein
MPARVFVFVYAALELVLGVTTSQSEVAVGADAALLARRRPGGAGSDAKDGHRFRLRTGYAGSARAQSVAAKRSARNSLNARILADRWRRLGYAT